MSGLIYQSYQVTRNIEKILIYLIVSAFISLLAFGKFENEGVYQIESHINFWVYSFVFVYLLVMWIEHDKYLKTSLNEGTSLLFSLGLLYWMYSKNLLAFTSIWTQLFSLVAVLFSLFSIIHALFPLKHHAFSRFILSLGSCVIIIILSVEHFIHLNHLADSNVTQTWADHLLLILQYFLLGISALYLFQNFILILQYLPNKYSSSYVSDVKATTQEHIQRYSTQQLSTFEALFCMFISLMAYLTNIYVQLIPTNVCIWWVIFCCPIILQHYYKPNIVHTASHPQAMLTQNQQQRLKNRKKGNRK
ncbi:hypothetical protein [Acinetobacter lanii]|uniref:Uncharacterized protein n=1 Tax=Acinetobacter lanii TaxID=2715163 RepID=A0A6G8S6M2_9GAMM|nr:hypothetical protein [Acinetobacter lanii]QIO09613.1 hypothetical protein G8D99_11760 [Acinetobacter lanii]